MWHAVFQDSPFALPFASKACGFQISHTYRSNLLHAKPSLNRTWCRASSRPEPTLQHDKGGQTARRFSSFSKVSVGVCTFQRFPIVPSIDLSVCLSWATLNRQAGLIWSFSCVLICHGDSFCKGHACVAGGLGSGVQRQPHVCLVVLCVL